VLLGAGLYFFETWCRDSDHLRGPYEGCRCVMCQGKRGDL